MQMIESDEFTAIAGLAMRKEIMPPASATFCDLRCLRHKSS